MSRVPPAGDAAWAGKRHPRFTQTLVRAFDVLTAQWIDHDRLATERVNVRIRWTTSVSEEIAKLIPNDGATRAALTQLLDTIREGNRSLPAGSRTYAVPPAGDVDAMTTARLVERVLRAAGDLEGKQIADVEVVTGDSDTPGAVTGRELVDFIVRRRRQAAFDAGYSRMLGWLENAPAINTRLGGEGGSLDACQAARAQLRKRPPHPSPCAHPEPCARPDGWVAGPHREDCRERCTVEPPPPFRRSLASRGIRPPSASDGLDELPIASQLRDEATPGGPMLPRGIPSAAVSAS